jgi:hypothetical protein
MCKVELAWRLSQNIKWRIPESLMIINPTTGMTNDFRGQSDFYQQT